MVKELKSGLFKGKKILEDPSFIEGPEFSWVKQYFEILISTAREV